MEDTTVNVNLRKKKKNKNQNFCLSYLVWIFLSNQTERGLEQLTQGLASLDISQANHTSATSTPVGGARPKVRLILTCEVEVKAEPGDVKAEPVEVTPEQSQSAASTLPQPQVSRKSDVYSTI